MKWKAPHLVSLNSSSAAGLRTQTAAAVEETLRLHAPSLLIGLDRLAILDDGVIAGTIDALRKLRNAGATVSLVTGSAAHRKRLSQLGLDRVFEILATPEDAIVEA